MLMLESGMTQDEINKCSLAASNAWADECMAKAIQPSKANVQTVAVRGAGPTEKLTVKTAPSDQAAFVNNRPEFEKVWNTYGSSAGSGSCSIPIYNKHRRIELARLEKMDKDHAALQEASEFQAKREAAMMADEAATDKKRSKRQKKKEAQKKAEQLKKEADGINKFGSDGSFMDMMAKMDPKVLEAEVRKAKEEAAQAAKEAALAKASTITPSQMSSEQNITIRETSF
ncbi:unnamed protein product [Effrenium voratum]|uniref:Uncharacterized protein n=1 Tax=Effrenium voratum TaxID=2562239 RepID=A0AA36IAI2_9DINO|nr:unnamed protein product [Effrenium voratum]CAJ1384005.1 unnamed protein product [Effrenium voratum]CAJ1434451.1 unnamed protein product [Effrenium voratum]|mmetsp:Transcript_120093/g.285297  ORF Transcript_120093/g.285297 Transcript_120093/m.285297 type:complete len:229 (+) Transcript_120093:99-785(+)